MNKIHILQKINLQSVYFTLYVCIDMFACIFFNLNVYEMCTEINTTKSYLIKNVCITRSLIKNIKADCNTFSYLHT